MVNLSPACENPACLKERRENAFAPYDETTYNAALDALRADDVVFDIGAGDLRFAIRAAQRVRRVIAVEQRRELLDTPMPPNITAFAAMRARCGILERLPALFY